MQILISQLEGTCYADLCGACFSLLHCGWPLHASVDVFSGDVPSWSSYLSHARLSSFGFCHPTVKLFQLDRSGTPGANFLPFRGSTCWLMFRCQRAPNPPEFAQPRLSGVKARSSQARGYKFGCVCSYMAGHEDAGVVTGHIGQICTPSLRTTTL